MPFACSPLRALLAALSLGLIASGCAPARANTLAALAVPSPLVVVTHRSGISPGDGTGAPANAGDDDSAVPMAAGTSSFVWARPGTIRLYVQPTTELPGWDARHLELVDEAVRAWTASRIVSVERVYWPREADVRLFWTDRLPRTNPGVTLLYRTRKGKLQRADVFIDVIPAPWNTGTPDRVLFATIAHELGHALGLGHDPAPMTLMHPSPLVTHVTEADLARLRSLLGN